VKSKASSIIAAAASLLAVAEGVPFKGTKANDGTDWNSHECIYFLIRPGKLLPTVYRLLRT
jgi:hypothetical protein